MKAKVQRVSFKNAKRIIAISDVHGNGHLLKKLLQRIRCCETDRLVLLGDHIEKGRESLDTLRFIKSLCAAGNAYALQGNCDTIWEDLKAKRYYGINLVQYMDWRKDSLLCDMCRELGLDPHAHPPEEVFCKLQDAYQELFAWLSALPQIIESENFIFVHAGLQPGALDAQDAAYCLRRDDFMHEAPAFNKPVVFGHMPTKNFCDFSYGRLVAFPLHDARRNLFAIDGGNAVSFGGQLNALIFQDGAFSSDWCDDLPSAIVCRPQRESSGWPNSVCWQHNAVQVLAERDGESLCRVLDTGAELFVPNERLFIKDGKTCAFDFTDYRPPLRIGESVSIVERLGTTCLIKHAGVFGLCATECLQFV